MSSLVTDVQKTITERLSSFHYLHHTDDFQRTKLQKEAGTLLSEAQTATTDEQVQQVRGKLMEWKSS